VRNNMPDYSFGEVVIKLFIEVLDHVIVTADGFVSIKDLGKWPSVMPSEVFLERTHG
jgi:hypothetical protein